MKTALVDQTLDAAQHCTRNGCIYYDAAAVDDENLRTSNLG